ncbi:MAG TPA: hypothetical protein VLQ93_21540, partial [Myxococcaceae bacterium]|nr:hypothetical protein [Myxococcaceae bacterium]
MRDPAYWRKLAGAPFTSRRTCLSTPVNRYDLWNTANYANPHPLYTRMREEGPLVRLYDPNQQMYVWLATRYKEAVELLRDSRFTKDIRKLPESVRERFQAADILSQLNQHMLSSDPPDHTRLRSLVAKAFTPR